MSYAYKNTFQKSMGKIALRLVNDPQIQDKILRRFDELMDDNKNADSSRAFHLYRNILPSIAVYQGCLESTADKDKSYKLAHAAMINSCKNTGKAMTVFGKLPFSYEIFRKAMPYIMKKSYDDKLWNFVWKQVDKEAIRVDAGSCLYFDTCVRYGVPELGSIFCEGDDQCYGSMKHIGWGRTITIAKGGDICDFYFYKK